MRLIRYAVLALIAICLIVIALANLQTVTLSLLPDELEALLGFSWDVTLPLFMIVFIFIAVGVVIGEVYEWVREHKHRAEAREMRKQRNELQREVKQERAKTSSDDEVLAILEGSGNRR